MVSRVQCCMISPVAFAAIILLTGCVPVGRVEPPEAGLPQPEFGPDTTSAPSQPTDTSPSQVPTTTDPGTPTEAANTETASESPSEATTTPPPASPAARFVGAATVVDDPSDRTTTVEPSPAWADLERIGLERDGDAMTLTIGLTGGAPDAAPDDQHTMNIATYFDVDGDGFIDYEAWANLSSTGWGTAYYDNVTSNAQFADEDGIDIELVDGALVMTFHADKIARAERFRFATSSEYGRYETIGTDLMARDDAPDDSQPAHFPG